MTELRVRPEAEVDAFEAAAWYEREREGLGSTFLTTVRGVFQRIESAPRQFPMVMADIRRALLGRFPFGVLRTLENQMAVSSVDAKVTPEAQLRSLIEKFDPKGQKLIRSVRSAVRKRVPAANELVYDYNSFFVIAYSSTQGPSDAIVATAARPDGVRLYFMHGPRLPDPKKLLMGSGKQARFIRLETARRLAHPDVEALIAAAIDEASVPLRSKGRGTLVIRTFGAKKRPRRKPAK